MFIIAITKDDDTASNPVIAIMSAMIVVILLFIMILFRSYLHIYYRHVCVVLLRNEKGKSFYKKILAAKMYYKRDIYENA